MGINASEIANEIARLCEERNISYTTLAKRSGLRKSTVLNMFEVGTTPTYRTLKRMCNGLGITVSQFFNQSDFLESLSPQEQELMSYFLKMDEKNCQRVLKYARSMLSSHHPTE